MAYMPSFAIWYTIYFMCQKLALEALSWAMLVKVPPSYLRLNKVIFFSMIIHHIRCLNYIACSLWTSLHSFFSFGLPQPHLNNFIIVNISFVAFYVFLFHTLLLYLEISIVFYSYIKNKSSLKLRFVNSWCCRVNLCDGTNYNGLTNRIILEFLVMVNCWLALLVGYY